MGPPAREASIENVEFSPEQRERLSLGPDDSVRVLSSGPHTILLERAGGARNALPWDRDLVVTADVRAFALADILHLLHSSAKTGFLFFEDGSHAKSVYLHRGEVVFAESNQSFDRLGECLLRAGVITPEQFRDARRAYTPSSRYGKILVERGYLTPRELWNGVKVQVEEIVRSLFSYGAGSVHFWEGQVHPDNVVRLSLPTRRLIAEGLRRRDELLKFLAWLEDPQVRLSSGVAESEALGETERAVVAAAREESSFAEVCCEAGVDPLTGARTVQLLKLIGSISVVKVPREDDLLSDIPEPRPGDEEQISECVRRHLKLMAELAAPIVAVEGGGGLQGRMASVLDESARRYPELMADVEVGVGGCIDPEVLIERALRFPGEREREVRLALGELLSYLEFDLLNHPKLENPEEFLEAVEDLRAAL
jgi:hypothetical protein